MISGDRSVPPVLVTGATGQLGAQFIHRLNRSDIVPRALVRKSYSALAWGDLQVDEVPGDLTDFTPTGAQKLDRALVNVDTVYHLAAYVHVGTKNHSRHDDLNRKGTARLYEAAARMGVRRFLHVSTIGAVGGGLTDTPLDENADWNLASFRNPYFDTKRAAEEYLLSEKREELTGPEIVIVNPSIILGSRKSVRSRNRYIEKSKIPPTLSVTEIPLWTRWLKLWPFVPPVSINVVDGDDVSEGILLAAGKGRPGERYILAGWNLTFRDIATALRPWVPMGPLLIPVPRRLLVASGALTAGVAGLFRVKTKWTADRARLSSMRWFYSTGKAERELGWKKTPFPRTLEKILGSADRGNRGDGTDR